MRLKSFTTQAAVAILAALLGYAAVYGTLGRRDNDSAVNEVTGQQPAVKTGAPGKGLNSGAMTAFVYKKTPEALPEVSFVDGQGAAKTLKDFQGKTVLLNLWATWCAPCREEMPALDRLQKRLGSDSFEVVALAVDRTGIEGAKKFLDGIKVENLNLYADPTTRSGPTLKAIGMPTTILIGKDGHEVGRLPGPAAWDSDEAVRLVEAHLR